MVQKPMAQYLHDPEDQQRHRNIFLWCRGELETIKEKQPLSTTTSMKQQSGLKHSEWVPATASCHFQSAAPTVLCGRKPKRDKCLQEPQGHVLQTLKTAVQNSCSDNTDSGKVLGPK